MCTWQQGGETYPDPPALGTVGSWHRWAAVPSLGLAERTWYGRWARGAGGQQKLQHAAGGGSAGGSPWWGNSMLCTPLSGCEGGEGKE